MMEIKKTKMKLLGGQTERIINNSLLSSAAGRHMHSGTTYHVPYDMKETLIFFQPYLLLIWTLRYIIIWN